MEGLGEVVVGAQLQPDHLVCHLVPSREHDDRNLAGLPDLPADGEAVHAGQHDVEHDQVGLELAEAVEGLDAVRHAFDLVALPAQVESRQLDDVLLIVDHEDLLTGGYG